MESSTGVFPSVIFVEKPNEIESKEKNAICELEGRIFIPKADYRLIRENILKHDPIAEVSPDSKLAKVPPDLKLMEALGKFQKQARDGESFSIMLCCNENEISSAIPNEEQLLDSNEKVGVLAEDRPKRINISWNPRDGSEVLVDLIKHCETGKNYPVRLMGLNEALKVQGELEPGKARLGHPLSHLSCDTDLQGDVKSALKPIAEQEEEAIQKDPRKGGKLLHQHILSSRLTQDPKTLSIIKSLIDGGGSERYPDLHIRRSTESEVRLMDAQNKKVLLWNPKMQDAQNVLKNQMSSFAANYRPPVDPVSRAERIRPDSQYHHNDKPPIVR